jgi:hypothetical protein
MTKCRFDRGRKKLVGSRPVTGPLCHISFRQILMEVFSRLSCRRTRCLALLLLMLVPQGVAYVKEGEAPGPFPDAARPTLPQAGG